MMSGCKKLSNSNDINLESKQTEGNHEVMGLEVSAQRKYSTGVMNAHPSLREAARGTK